MLIIKDLSASKGLFQFALSKFFDLFYVSIQSPPAILFFFFWSFGLKFKFYVENFSFFSINVNINKCAYAMLAMLEYLENYNENNVPELNQSSAFHDHIHDFNRQAWKD